MAKLIFDKAKMKELGGGSIKEFCNLYNFKRNNLYRIENTTKKTKGTYAHHITERLIAMGCASWVNEPKESVA